MCFRGRSATEEHGLTRTSVSGHFTEFKTTKGFLSIQSDCSHDAGHKVSPKYTTIRLKNKVCQDDKRVLGRRTQGNNIRR